jgi:REP element-mobilizing transposase RayT
MKKRDYKESVEGGVYHIYNRGNSKDDIFLDEGDYSFFTYRLRQNLFPQEDPNFAKYRIQPLPPNSFSLLGYCLMPNHFHLLVKQNGSVTTSKLLLKLTTSYSKFFNKRHGRVGHVFQDQFKQAEVRDDKYLTWLSAYIHQNPKVAGLINDPAKYKWSSYADYINDTPGTIIQEQDLIMGQFKSKAEYINFVNSSYKIIKDKKELEDHLLDF